MSEYTPPIEDMNFIITQVFKGQGLGGLDEDMVDAILEEAGKVASGLLAPINKIGDEQGSQWTDGEVKTADGFKEAYKEYCAGGWNSVPFKEEYGGQNLPWSMAFPIQEMWQAANMSFGLCPLLNQGAAETILAHGSDEQKQEYLPNMVSGLWTGTMNLTESQAGSDLGEIKTKAVKQGDGTYLITGQKIFITFGEHDMSENIIHLVLARTQDAPTGSKGISLFIVPKFLEDKKRNDLICVSLEHKMGIHASPTCTMSFGDNGGATGYVVGEENLGLKYMFTMMNNARLSVGLQGVAIADRALQQSVSYAGDRIQGSDITTGQKTEIINHADVQRMINTMQTLVMAGRTLAYESALYLDQGKSDYVDLLTPIVKSWCTDMAQEVTSTAIQVHGGMGFIEETGVAQYARDARILPIYEGTNGIQALDLTFRKILKNDGALLFSYLDEVKDIIAENVQLQKTVEGVRHATNALVKKTPVEISAVATPYLNGLSYVMGGIAMMRRHAALQALDDGTFKTKQRESIRFYMESILPRAEAELFIFV